ncbi:hypothetical protein MYX82_08260 [Acidobacteria bacterium AH-259-D05]|nr:hypothetical protein [Acidobacteria bacterium AH-259-D05]
MGTRSRRIKSLLLLAVLTYLCSQMIPIALRVYTDRQNFHSKLVDIAGQATLRQWNDTVILKQVQTLAKNTGFEVSRRDIVIQRVRGRPEVTLVVRYSKMAGFPGGFDYRFHFSSAVQGFRSF